MFLATNQSKHPLKSEEINLNQKNLLIAVKEGLFEIINNAHVIELKNDTILLNSIFSRQLFLIFNRIILHLQ